MKTALLATAACLIVLSSCKKDTSSSPAANNYRLKTYTEATTSPNYGNQTITLNFSYDASGRVASAVSSTSPGDKFVYTYPGNNKYSMDLYNANMLSIHEDFFTNSKSLLDSTFQYDDSQDTTTEKYLYNAASQLVQLNEYNYSKQYGSMLNNTTSYTYDASGNMIKTADTDGKVETYEYYTDLSYVMPDVSGTLLPNTSKKMNLIKKMTLTYGGYAAGTADYTYTFDSSNRISTQKIVSSDGTVVLYLFVKI